MTTIHIKEVGAITVEETWEEISRQEADDSRKYVLTEIECVAYPSRNRTKFKRTKIAIDKNYLIMVKGETEEKWRSGIRSLHQINIK